MKEVPLTQGKFAIVDDEDFERLNQYKWCVAWDRYRWYVQREIRIDNKAKKIFMHREILNAPKGMHVDHINGDGLDNRKKNLRFCTIQQNAFNQKKPRKSNKLGVKGVYWHKKGKKFRAQIMFNGKSIHLGVFNMLSDADSAYRKAEKQYFGEFARRCN